MPRIVRKYGNRRLYDTQDSCYINLGELAALIKAGEEVLVEDATTKADLTRELYFQVLFEHEGAMDFLPLGMLRRIIRATGEDPGQKVLRQQLGQAFHLLSDQMDRLEQTFGAFTPKPAAPPRKTKAEPPPEEPEQPEEPPKRGKPTAAASEPKDDLAALRERLAALEGRLR